MTDRFVDGQPQVGRVDHQVVAAGDDRGGADLVGQQPRYGVELGLPVPAVPLEVLPTASRRWRHAPHGLEVPVRVDGQHFERGMDPNPALGGLGAGQVRVEGVLGDGQHLHGHVIDAVCRQEPAAPFVQQADLVGQGHVRRIDGVGRGPRQHPVAGLVGQLDGHASGPGDQSCGHHRLFHQSGGFGRVGGHRGGKAHATVDHDPDAHA